MSIEQKRGIITLLPKDGKDLRLIKNWHPFSLLNTDYRTCDLCMSKSEKHFCQN